MLRGPMDNRPAAPSDEVIRTWVANCDPAMVLGPDDARYVAIDEGEPVRGSGGRSCVEAMFRTIDLAGDDRPTTQLFTGFIGTGKSTELRRLERLFSERTTSRNTEVVFLNFDEHYIDLNSPIEVSEVLRVIAFALDAAAIVAESKADAPISELHEAPARLTTKFKSGSYLKHLFDQLRSITPELSKVEFEAGGVKLMGELRSNPLMRAQASLISRFQFEQFVADARQYMARAVARIKRARSVDRVVVIADGIEKIRAKREADRQTIESSVESLFVDHSEYLALPCHAIYTFHLALRYRHANIGQLYSARPSILPMVKVCLPDGSPFEPGIEKLRDLLARRVDLQQLFGGESVDEQSVLRHVIRVSGGYVRDLLRVTRDAIYSAESFPLTRASVDGVLRELVQNYQLVLRTDDLPLLDQVARTHLAPSEQDVSVERFGRLIDQQMVLGYRNGLADTPEWYRLHPLVEQTRIYRSARTSK
jgi:hypothetical protein